MLALEETFDIEFREASVRKSTCPSVASIEATISPLRLRPTCWPRRTGALLDPSGR
jgi:hypothetical protein